MPRLPSIPYRSAPPPTKATAPSEFDHAYERERGRWLRRRFLWYVGFSLGVGLLTAVPTLWVLLTRGESQDAGWIVTLLLVSNGMYLAAMVFGWRARPVYAHVLRVALVTYVSATLVGIAFTHLFYVTSATDFHAGVIKSLQSNVERQARRDADRRPATTRATTAPSDPAATAAPVSAPAPAATSAPAMEDGLFGGPMRTSYLEPIAPRLGPMRPTFTAFWAFDNLMYWVIWGSLLLSIAFNHLLISMFLPWAVRDSMRPAVLIGAAFLFMVLVDACVGVAWWPTALAAAALLPLAFVPGTLVCWWRYSRFNRQFKQRFESAGYRAMQNELVGARRIHEALLPAPVSEGRVRVAFAYEPMRQIGGDLVMVHRASPDALCVVLFDVMGHGVSAALSVNRIVGEVERTFAETPDAAPERVIRNLNRYVCLTLARQSVYVTALAARLDAAAGTLSYANAGHPPAVFVPAGRVGSVRALESTAMMLGVCDEAGYDCETITLDLAPGDALVAYTDGASEAADPAGAMLGCDGVERTIAGAAAALDDPAAWPALVRDQVLSHRSAPPQDDTLIVAMWRSGQ